MTMMFLRQILRPDAVAGCRTMMSSHYHCFDVVADAEAAVLDFWTDS